MDLPTELPALFVLASVAMLVSYLGLSLNRERDGGSVKNHPSLLGYLRMLPGVLRATAITTSSRSAARWPTWDDGGRFLHRLRCGKVRGQRHEVGAINAICDVT
jgi:hypothetical protein